MLYLAENIHPFLWRPTRYFSLKYAGLILVGISQSVESTTEAIGCRELTNSVRGCASGS